MAELVRLNVETVGDVTVVKFLERLVWEMFQVEQIQGQLEGLVEKQGCRRLLLDFSGVEMISSSTLGILLSLKQKLDEGQGRMVIAGLREELMRIFKITRLEGQFEFRADREAALAAFAPPAGGEEGGKVGK
jgi:anti-sigma B factor antagonist